MNFLTIGERIKTARKALDLTQKKFASEIGTSQNVLANYEIGRRNPSASVINNIYKTFNINEDWLRSGEGEPFVLINKEQQFTDAYIKNYSKNVQEAASPALNIEMRIRQLRKTLDLTQQEFAEKIGIKRNTIANYETGRNEPVDSVIALICRKFNVNKDWLRTREGEPFVPINKEQQLMNWAKSVFNPKDGDFKRRFVTMLMNLNENEWKLIEAKAKELVGDTSTNIPQEEITVEEAEAAYIKSHSRNVRKTASPALNIIDGNARKKSEAI